MRTDYIKFCLLVVIGVVAFIFAIAEGDTLLHTFLSKVVAVVLMGIDLVLYKHFER